MRAFSCLNNSLTRREDSRYKYSLLLRFDAAALFSFSAALMDSKMASIERLSLYFHSTSECSAPMSERSNREME